MERIHVAVRARPLSPEDAKSSPWLISGNSIFMPNNSSKFEFDKILGQDCETVEVYQARTKEIVAAAVRGFNGTVFAYGQTNSGKTYTMRGSASELGVIPLAVHDVFDTIDQVVDREFLLRMSYMEIYNEEINDLLVPEHRKLQIHENLERGIYVAGLREEIVASPEQVLRFMEFGESHRHIGETNMNVHSSRSHTIFRMIIESKDKTEDEDVSASCDAVRVSVLNLVDLAGSERAAKTGAEGVRLKEGSHINKSLMTLGTVIKKLSEGAESQGGHVPYRDSKLTRILQPALGGNANTAMICNITLAQIHADETKSSLQFASRALRVTNCAHVNEILTDAALLKRQKKEIEELRAKLQGSHSEHLEKEILNLRNTLLQIELERERIALELEEERKSQAECEKRLQEQAKKIENLSTMVLCSSRDENRDRFKKDKRRDTWCPGNLAREALGEVNSTMQSKASDIKTRRTRHDMGPLLPFEEIINEIDFPEDESCKLNEECKSNASEGCKLPDPCALLHITNRRKLPPKKKSSPEDNELAKLQLEYEDLLIRYESQRTESEMQIDYLKGKLAEYDTSGRSKDYSAYDVDKDTNIGDRNFDSKESEAILVIKRLQEKIKVLEMESSSSQQNLDSVVELATEQNIFAREKFEELHNKLLIAQEEARVAHEQLTSNESEGNSAFGEKLLIEVQDIISEVNDSTAVFMGVYSLLDEVSKTFSVLNETFLDFKNLMCLSSLQEKSIISNHEKLTSCLMQKVSKLENEKCLLYNQSVELQNQIEELKLDAQNSEESLRALLEQRDSEKEEHLFHIQVLEKEISGFSSCSLAKEKETLRKDLEKTKMKLKDTEFRLKTAMQEKTKLEGEKAVAEREIKRLNGQKSLLERDIHRRESVAGRRRDSCLDKGSNMGDPKRSKGPTVSFDQTLQEYNKLEVYAFELETKIASLEEQLSTEFREKEEIVARNEDMTSELEGLSEKLNTSSLDLSLLQEEISALRQSLEVSELEHQKMERSIQVLVEEKEELAMQLSESLLEMEEERAVWSAKERASVEAIEEKARVHDVEIRSLSEELSEVRNELESYKQECETIRERLTCSEEEKETEKSSMNDFLGTNQLTNDVNVIIEDVESKKSQEISNSHQEIVGCDRHHACEDVDMLEKDLNLLKKEKEDLLIQIRELNTRPDLSHDFEDLKNQLCVMKEEMDRLTTQIQEQQTQAVEVEFLNKRYNDMLVQANVQVEELNRKISNMEVNMHDDQVKTNKERAKLRMRLLWTQAKLDAFRNRSEELAKQSDHMDKKYEEATRKLKEHLASKVNEILSLKKQLADVN
ncbi:hypothetical protein UlMin_010255 [Ulmus minor]